MHITRMIGTSQHSSQYIYSMYSWRRYSTLQSSNTQCADRRYRRSVNRECPLQQSMHIMHTSQPVCILEVVELKCYLRSTPTTQYYEIDRSTTYRGSLKFGLNRGIVSRLFWMLQKIHSDTLFCHYTRHVSSQRSNIFIPRAFVKIDSSEDLTDLNLFGAHTPFYLKK